LGDGALAHISLVHVKTDVDPRTAFEDAQETLGDEFEVSLGPLTLAPYPRGYNAPDPQKPGVVAGLTVTTSEELRDLEKAALALQWVEDGEITTRNGRRFWPHITLGTMDSVPAQVPLPADLLDRDHIATRLAIGPIGPHGIFEEVLAGGW
jgi:hypothetical protein